MSGKETARPEDSQAQRHPRSFDLSLRARRVFPDGLTRSTVQRKPFSLYAERGVGPYLFDADGHRYLDLNNNFTTLIHGHCFGPITQALTDAVGSGCCFAQPTRSEIELAELLVERVPSIDCVRFVNTGTEAVMFAIKAARALTGRSKIAKFEGAYHGSYDWAEVSEAASPLNWGPAESPHPTAPYKGTPLSVLQEVVPIPFNDLPRTQALLQAHAAELACVLIDLMPGRAGLVPIEPAYVEFLREFTRCHGILLIDDEILNFRQGYAGAAARYGIEPDLITLGKIIGGGLPIGAIAGRRQAMEIFGGADYAPAVPQSGTFTANPLSMRAGFACMSALTHDVFARLHELGDYARAGLTEVFREQGWPLVATGYASLLRIHARAAAPRSYREAYPTKADRTLMNELCEQLLLRGFAAPANASWCLSSPMTRQHVDDLLAAFRDIESLVSLAGES